MTNLQEHKNIITISELTKKFGRKTVLSDIKLEINRGDSIAFVGRNGSGKSTLLKIIAGLLPFEKGKVIHNGKLKFAYVPERFPAMNLTARDYISQIGMISGLQKEDVNKRGNQLFEALFMQDMIETPIRYLSKGTIQKMAVVQAFLTTPDVLLLDEPISGQDMASQRVFIEMVNTLNRVHGVTILCSCHEDYMVQAIARIVYEIVGGKLHQTEHAEKLEIDDICRLLFTKPGGEITISEPIRNAAVKIELLEGREVAVYIKSSDSNNIIRQMLHDNFELRGVNNARIF